MKEKRRIIQIAIESPDGEHVSAATLYALCNDGTVWFRYFGEDKVHWQKVPPIPQD